MERVREKKVAQQDARLIAPQRVDRRHVSADGGAIEHIVVNKRGRVNHLHDGAEQMMRGSDFAAGQRRQQQ